MAFSFSSAINNLVAGASENVADVVTCFNDVKAVLNNGITGTDHLSASAAVADTQLASPNNATYKQIASLSPYFNTTTNGSTYLIGPTSVFATSMTAITSTGPIWYLDPADYTAGAKTNKYRLKVALATNATAPLSTFTFGLYPVSAVAGGAGAVTPTLGAVTAGSTVAFAAQGASTLGQANSGDFTAPAAGYYLPAMAVTVASQAANSTAVATLILQQRQV